MCKLAHSFFSLLQERFSTIRPSNLNNNNNKNIVITYFSTFLKIVSGFISNMWLDLYFFSSCIVFFKSAFVLHSLILTSSSWPSVSGSTFFLNLFPNSSQMSNVKQTQLFTIENVKETTAPSILLIWMRKRIFQQHINCKSRTDKPWKLIRD